MKPTPYHAKYIAHELTRRCASDSVERLTAVLSDAQVDLNPHQIEAALFAFRNPLARGAILADEVGLGKTIEAGLLISQGWAEGIGLDCLEYRGGGGTRRERFRPVRTDCQRFGSRVANPVLHRRQGRYAHRRSDEPIRRGVEKNLEDANWPHSLPEN
jgi:hypothetical protein